MAMTCTERASGGARGRCGMTFIEVMFALLLLSTGLVAVLTGLHAATMALSRTRTHLRTDFIAREWYAQAALQDVLPRGRGGPGQPTVVAGWTRDHHIAPRYSERARVHEWVLYRGDLTITRNSDGEVARYGALTLVREVAP